MMVKWLVLFSTYCVVMGCGVQREYEEYAVIDPSWDFRVTQTTHPHGWGRSDCFYCHAKQNIHRLDKIGNLDLVAVAMDESENSPGPGCSFSCHGTNGVSP